MDTALLRSKILALLDSTQKDLSKQEIIERLSDSNTETTFTEVERAIEYLLSAGTIMNVAEPRYISIPVSFSDQFPFDFLVKN